MLHISAPAIARGIKEFNDFIVHLGYRTKKMTQAAAVPACIISDLQALTIAANTQAGTCDLKATKIWAMRVNQSLTMGSSGACTASA
jgi:hypothetical protein